MKGSMKLTVPPSSQAKVPIRFPLLPLGGFRQIFLTLGQYATDMIRILFAGIGVTSNVPIRLNISTEYMLDI